MSEAEVEAYNRRELWNDVVNHLRVARESYEQALSALDDVGAKPHLIKAVTQIEGRALGLVEVAEHERSEL